MAHPFLISSRSTVAGHATVAFAVVLAGCSPIDLPPGGQTFFPTTPHEGYEYSIREMGLERTALGFEWITAARTALDDALGVRSPYEEVGYLEPLTAQAMGYRIEVERGQLLRVDVELDGDEPGRVFLDLYRAMDDTLRPHRHEAFADSGSNQLEVLVRRDGNYVVRVQPELLRGGRYRIRIVTAASLAFPVQGQDMSAIRSVWGDSRDGGRRAHQGVDIFAPRGTPAIAATDGVVRRVRNGGLGGRTVWLRDAYGQSLYYAHLDSQAVVRGQEVRAGDTLGFVGNTGNARTTPPHLHFGIYARGAYNPWPALNPVNTRPPRLSADVGNVGGWARSSARELRLRASPSTRGEILGTLGQYTPMRVIGGAAGWYRVMLPDGSMGFVAASSLEPANAPIRSAEVQDGAVILERPAITAAVKDSIGAGDLVEVLGSFGDFLYVQRNGGPAGWLSPLD